MAGGKEAPRQKMINMMYLVLTAMLALQVSNAILEKFLLINNSLEKFSGNINNQNDNAILFMKEAIAKSEKPENKKFMDQALLVRSKSAEVVSYIETLKNLIIDAGGGPDPEKNARVKNLAEQEKVTQLMVGAGKKGKGYDLKAELDKYITYVQQYSNPESKLKGLALSASEDDNFKKFSGASILNKDFAQLNFGDTPVPAALAVLSQKQAEVRSTESEVLDYLSSRVTDRKYIKFDQVFAFVSAESRTVVAGQKYKAQVAIGAFSSTITPRISVNGSTIPVDKGVGQIEFIAQGGRDYDSNGQLQKKYTAMVSYPDANGTMQTVTKEESYTVLKPSVQIESGTMPPLYFKCANKLQVNSPGLGSLFKPTFSGSGADFLPGTGGKVTVVPNASRVELNVNNDGNLLQTFPFKVQLVPKPDLVIYVNGSPLGTEGEKKGVPASSVRSIEVRAIADNSFKNTNPDDANFRVSGVVINLASGIRSKGKKEGTSGASVADLANLAEPGDRYVITINGAERKNFRGEVLPVEVGQQVRTINLN